MQTHLADFIRDTPAGHEAQEIIGKCVHCGFCTATCPTYQLQGDELDGPRGRIYLIKQMLEGEAVSAKTRLHLDRCLTCRACETTCPSGVRYARLLDIGRAVIARQAPQRGVAALQRRALKAVVPNARIFGAAYWLGRIMRPLLPALLRAKLPQLCAEQRGVWPASPQPRRMIALAGCAQAAMAPDINAAAARLLHHLGVALVEAPNAGCCGALRFHLDDIEGARRDARRNIDAWLPLLENGHEAIVMTASGCGVMVRDYAHLLADDARYAPLARRIADATVDFCEALSQEMPRLAALFASAPDAPLQRVAFHAPCTLQHGQGIRGVVETLLTLAGYTLTPVAEAHLCCGSAGTYSLLQKKLAGQLVTRKIKALTIGEPQLICSANIGCIAHLQAATKLPVRHWVELLALRLPPGTEQMPTLNSGSVKHQETHTIGKE